MNKNFIKNGLSIPPIGLGTGSGNLMGRKCRKVVCKAIEFGYRHIDTASMYLNEADVGNGIVDSQIDRNEIFLTTKINTLEFDNNQILDSFNKSLSELKTEYVDLLLIHWPKFTTNLGDLLDIMYEIKNSNSARAIGVSNFNSTLLNECKRLGFNDIFCNQIEYHPYLSQKILLKEMLVLNVIPVAYCPLYRGKVSKDSIIKKISKKYNKTPSQITLRWLFQQNVVSIPKTVKKRRLKENIDIFDFFIEDQDMNLIHSLASGKRQVKNLETDPFLGAWD